MSTDKNMSKKSTEKNNGRLSAIPPETLQKLKWIWLYGREHKLYLIAATVLILALWGIKHFLPFSQTTNEQQIPQHEASESEVSLEPFDEGVFGVLIAPFAGDNEEQRERATEIQGTIEKTLNARFRELAIHNTEARAIPASVLPQCRNHEEAREIGNDFHAEIVIWGHVTIAGVIPNLTIVNPHAPASLIVDTEAQFLKNELTHKALEDVNEIRLPAFTDEPLLIASFTIGTKYYRDGKYDDALHYLTCLLTIYRSI